MISKADVMKKAIYILILPLLLCACEDAKEAGDTTAREITGANMIEQGRQAQQQLHEINRQQQQRLEQLE